MSNRIYFRIAVGDYSNDGHGKCEYFTASSDLPIEDVREAYYKAKEILPDIICPEEFLNQYEESEISKDVIDALKKAGYTDFNSNNFYVEDMAKYVCWFINIGNFACNVKLEPDVDDMLQFYGTDDKGRHIGFFGYGLLGD